MLGYEINYGVSAVFEGRGGEEREEWKVSEDIPVSKDPLLFGGVPVLRVPPNSQILTIQIRNQMDMVTFSGKSFPIQALISCHSHECGQFGLQGKFLCLQVCMYICESMVWLVT